MGDLSPSPEARKLVSFNMIESYSHLLRTSERDEFVVACKKAGDNHEPLQPIMTQYFSTWKTSLVADDLVRLEMLADYPQIRDCIKVICLEDELDTCNYFNEEDRPPPSPYIWPRYPDGQVIPQALGLDVLITMLATQQLRLDRLEIRDTYCANTPNARANPEIAAILARTILDGSDLAMTTFILEKESGNTTFIVAELSAEHQGQGIDFSMLRKAELCLQQCPKPDSYWFTQVLFHAPGLKELSLGFSQSELSYMPHFILDVDKKAWPALEKFEISSARLSTQGIMTILTNSRQTLKGISFSMELDKESTWKELLRRIGKEFPHLTSFKLVHLSEWAGPVNFLSLEDSVLNCNESYKTGLKMVKKGPAGNQRIRVIKYEGPYANHVLRVAAECAVSTKTF